jgi:hypothetical protein
MTIRSRQFAGLVPAIVLGALAGVFAAQAAPLHAANECLSGPKGAAPKGSHWYYRVDRATKKNCWYVRAESKQAPAARASEANALPQPETALQPSVANARAEADPAIVEQRNVAPEPAPLAGAGNIAEVPPAPDTSPSTVASRWLDQPAGETNNTSSPPPAVSDSSTPAAAPAAPADMRAAVPSALFPPLLLVIVGALVAAAGVAGAIYRFGSARRNELQEVDQPHAPWDVMDIGATIRSPPLASEAASPRSDPVHDRHAAVIPDEIVHLLSTLSKEAPA